MKSRLVATITRTSLFAALAVVSLFAQGQPSQKAQHTRRYAVTDIGTLGGTFGIAYGVSNKAWVDGVANLPGDKNQHGFLWIEGLKLDLGTFGGQNSTAGYPANEKGQVVGIAESATPDPLGEEFCDFVGWNTHLICLPFIWENGVMTQLPTLGGYNGGTNQINNRGQIAGMSQNPTFDTTCPTLTLEQKPVLYENGGIQELPTFPGDPDGFANAINDHGQIVGSTGNCTLDGIHGLLWNWINDKGQMVGQSCDVNFNCRAVIWVNGVITDLNSFVRPGSPLYLLAAFTINGRGQITGLALQTKTGQLHGFLANLCDRDDQSRRDCKPDDEGNALPADAAADSKVVLPTNVQGLLRQRFGARAGTSYGYKMPKPKGPQPSSQPLFSTGPCRGCGS